MKFTGLPIAAALCDAGCGAILANGDAKGMGPANAGLAGISTPAHEA
jgi:hypothetical protein